MGVWNGWGYGIAIFRAQNFQISEPEILQKIALSAEFHGFSWKIRPLKNIFRTLENYHSIRHQSIPPLSAGRVVVGVSDILLKYDRRIFNMAGSLGQRRSLSQRSCRVSRDRRQLRVRCRSSEREAQEHVPLGLSDPRNRNRKSLAIGNHNFEIESFSRRNRSNQGAAKGVRQKEFDHFLSFSGRFRSLFGHFF